MLHSLTASSMLFCLATVAQAETNATPPGTELTQVGEKAAQVGNQLVNQKPHQAAIDDHGGLFFEMGSQAIKTDGHSSTIPIYGLGADLNALNWDTSAGVFQLGGNFDVQYMRGKSGGSNIRAETYSAGPTACWWFYAGSSFCLEADASEMTVTQAVTYHLGTLRGGASFRQILSDQYMAKLSYEGGNYSTSGKDLTINNILLALSWRPRSSVR